MNTLRSNTVPKCENAIEQYKYSILLLDARLVIFYAKCSERRVFCKIVRRNEMAYKLGRGSFFFPPSPAFKCNLYK